MKTKTIELFGDLYPGWQDCVPPCVQLRSGHIQAEKLDGWLRVKVTVELPCFGGSAETDLTVKGTAEIDPTSPSPK